MMAIPIQQNAILRPVTIIARAEEMLRINKCDVADPLCGIKQTLFVGASLIGINLPRQHALYSLLDRTRLAIVWTECQDRDIHHDDQVAQ